MSLRECRPLFLRPVSSLIHPSTHPLLPLHVYSPIHPLFLSLSVILSSVDSPLTYSLSPPPVCYLTSHCPPFHHSCILTFVHLLSPSSAFCHPLHLSSFTCLLPASPVHILSTLLSFLWLTFTLLSSLYSSFILKMNYYCMKVSPDIPKLIIFFSNSRRT